MNTLTIGLSLSAALFVLMACGGEESSLTDQGGSIAQPPNEASPSVNSNSGGVNGGLTGRIFTNYKNQPMQVDLATGLMTDVPIDSIQDWLARNGYPSNKSSYFGTGGTDSSQYIQTITDCIFVGGDLAFNSCVAIFSSNFEKIQQFQLTGIRVTSQAILSPSGKYVAANEFQTFAGVLSSELILIDVAERSIVEKFIIDIGAGGPRYISADSSPMAWAPNGALVYTVPSDDRVIVYITKPDSILEVAQSIALPALYQGEVESLDVSPDGSKLLMGYNPAQGPNLGGILLLDFETLRVSVPAIVPSEVDTAPLGDNIKGLIRTPRWSPDGKWIMVVEGLGRLVDFNFATSEELYAVPADKTRTVLTKDSPTDAILIHVEYPDSPGLISDSWYGDTSYFDWAE